VKEVRSYGTVEKRENGTYRARTGRTDGHKTLGHYKTKEEAEKALEDYKLRHGIEIDDTIEDVVGQASKPWAELQQDSVEINTGTLTEPITDWDSILLSFGLDPEHFSILDDKVRMSKWQSSKRLENGDRDVIFLYSYRATFVRNKSPKISEEDIEEVRKSIRRYKPTTIKLTTDAPSTFVVLWADWQLGKSASGGVKATIERIHDSFNKTHNRTKELQKLGRNIEQIAFVNMGDPTEMCDNFYSSQTFTVQLNQRQQLLTALDLWTVGVTSMCDLAPKTKFISTLSNHGEWTRRNGKSITGDSDSADAFLADTLQRILGRDDIIDDWHIPHDEMTTQVNLSGVECAFTHGHKMAGKEVEWLRGQTLRLLRDNGAEPRIWFGAHKHHFRTHDYGSFTFIQCPSLDSSMDGSTSGGSKWFTDSSSQWSSPGTCTLLVGNHDKRMWSDLAVL
jgi:hypothetical protein